MTRKNQELIKELIIPPPDYQDLSFPTKYSQKFYGRSMRCKLLEAIPFLLKESTLQCHVLSDDISLGPSIWYSILAKTKEHVRP